MNNEEKIIDLLEQILVELKWKNAVSVPFVITEDNNNPVNYADICPCNPKNGGSGICNCILGGMKLTCNK